MNNSNHFDALIVGSGIAACATAHHLLAAGGTVALLNRPGDFPGTESVPADAARKLRAIGITLGSPLGEVVAWWGSDTPSQAHSPGALAVQRSDLANALRTRVFSQGARLITTRRIVTIERNERRWEVRCEDEQGMHIIHALAIVDATGRAACAARLLGARRYTADNLCCLSATVAHSSRTGVWTESRPDGWWNLCSDGSHATISFFSASAIIREARADFTNRLADTKHLSSVITPDRLWPLTVRPCSSSLLQPCAGPGWVAIGDAAMTFHPLASAGIAKALADAEKVSNAFLRPGQYDFGHQNIFSNYLATLGAQYRLETRWPSSPFWSRRAQSGIRLSAAA